MTVIKVRGSGLNPGQLKKITAVLKEGGTVVYPTDTAYGLGADATNAAAIGRVYEIKKRSAQKALSIMVSAVSDLGAIVVETEDSRRLVRDFWPGALTLVLKKKGEWPPELTGGKKTLAVRLPDNKICSQLARALGKPITTTSANISGLGNFYSVGKIIGQFGPEDSRPDLIIDAGALPVTPPSTIIDLTTKNYKILRVGPVTNLELESSLGRKIS